MREPDHFDWQKQARFYWMHLPISPYTSPYLPISPCTSPYLPISPYTSPYLPISPHISKARFYWMHDDERAQICVADVPFWYCNEHPNPTLTLP